MRRNPKKIYSLVAKFQSRSDPKKFYEVKIDEEGNLSCNCPAWIFKKVGRRICEHVIMAERMLREQGMNPVGLYEAFHGSPPIRIRKVRYQPPNPKEALIKIGRLVQLNYRPEPPSKLSKTEFYHRSGDTGTKTLKSNLILATDRKGKNLYLLKDRRSKYPVFTERGILG